MSRIPASQSQHPEAVFSAEQLQALRDRIINSGELGRSKIYGKLLDYLLQSALERRQPKEVEIAIDVLGRSSEFDVGKDSVVRVYIHQLRKRLHNYYERHEPEAAHRLVIPRGQYTVASETMGPPSARDPLDSEPQRLPAQRGRLVEALRHRLAIPVLLGLVLVLLVGNVALLLSSERGSAENGMPSVIDHPMWRNVLADDAPVLLVMGDYYIFGELDASGRVDRMVRDFSINSREDLTRMHMDDSNTVDRYLDLDMTYMPEGSAYALNRIAPLLHSADKRVNVTMMSRLSYSDLRSNHIVYIGYVSALDKLHNLYFSASGLQIGRSFDELYNRQTREFYVSDAGLPDQGQTFRDIGLLATFPLASNHQVVIISGTRDAGLMQAAQAAVNTEALHELDNSLGLDAGRHIVSQEALFEVFGLDRMNFDANTIYTRELDPTRVWSRQLE